MQRSRLRGREQRRHIWRWMQTNRVIQMIVINDTIVLCTTTTAWSDSKMSRDAFSGAKVPEVYDDSVATTLKVIMDVLKVKSFFPRKLNFYYTSVRPALFYIIIITAFETTVTFLVIVCKLAGFFYVWIFRWVIVKGDRDQDLSFDLDQTFANLFASILCTFQYCLLSSKTCHSHKSNFPMFYHHDFF